MHRAQCNNSTTQRWGKKTHTKSYSNSIFPAAYVCASSKSRSSSSDNSRSIIIIIGTNFQKRIEIHTRTLSHTHIQTHYSLLIAQDKWYLNLALYALHNFIQFITLCRKDYVHFQLLQWLDIFLPRKKKIVYFVLHLDPTSAVLSEPIDLNSLSLPRRLYVCLSKFLVFSKVNEIAWGRHTHNWFPSISVCSLNGIKPDDFPWIISLNWCEQ